MIIFTVLKVILKIILILLLIILLLLAALLLMRLKYSVSAEYDEGLDAEAQLSVLFGALKAIYRFGDGDEGLEVRIFGRAKKKKQPREDSGTDDEYDFYGDEEVDIPAEEEISADTAEAVPVDDPSESAEEADIPDAPKKAVQKEKKEETTQKQKKENASKPRESSTLQRLKSKVRSFDEFRERYDIPLLLRNLKIYVFQQLKSLGIKGGSVDGIVGLGDPSQTGLMLGGAGVIGAFVPIDVDISGDFEKKYIALNGSLYGKTYLLKLLLPILKLILKKPVRTILYDILFKKGSKK